MHKVIGFQTPKMVSPCLIKHILISAQLGVATFKVITATIS